MEIEVCRSRKDFIRHIANQVLAEALEKIPASAITEIRKRLGRLEDKYDFSAYGGKPERLVEALSSQEWKDLVDYAEKMNVTWVLHRILRLAADAYDECDIVKQKILAELSRLEKKGDVEEELNPDKIFRDLKYKGYKVIKKNNNMIIDEGNINIKISIINNLIEYTICKKGKTTSLDGLLTKINKIREI